MEVTQTIPEWKAAVDEIWVLFKETDRKMQEIDRKVQEIAQQMKETDREMQETSEQRKDTDRPKAVKDGESETMEVTQTIPEWKADWQKKRTNRWLDDLLRKRFGEMDDYMIIPNLMTEFEKIGFIFTQAGEVKITDTKHDLFLWVDAFLQNVDMIMAVDIKTKPDIDDIKDHIKRMEKLRRYADLHDDKRKYLGAIAGVVFGDSEKTYAFENGFYVIEPSGDTFNITEPTGAYYPHEW